MAFGVVLKFWYYTHIYSSFFLIDALHCCYKCSRVVYIHNIHLLLHSMDMLPKEYIGNIPLPLFRKLVKTFFPTFIFTIENAVLFDSYLWSCVWPYPFFSSSFLSNLRFTFLWLISLAMNLMGSEDYKFVTKIWIHIICKSSVVVYIYCAFSSGLLKITST